MRPITSYFNLPASIPFEDVDCDRDTAKFLCTFTIRAIASARSEPWACRFVHVLNDFMATVVRLLEEGTCEADQEAVDLLSRFLEPKECRLGYTAVGAEGHGMGSELGARLFESLTGDLDALVRVGYLKHLEDIQFFVDGVGIDRVSDMAGRIGLETLVNFTESMVKSYPELRQGPEGTSQFEYLTWDAQTHEWVTKSATLPTVAGHALVLVPSEWVDTSPIMTDQRFLDLATADVLQSSYCSRDSEGKPPSKKDLKKTLRPFSAAEVNLRVALEVLESDGQDLIAYFYSRAIQTLRKRFEKAA